MALADGLRAGDQQHLAIVLEPNIDIFRRIAAGRLDVTGKTQSAETAASFTVVAAGGETGQIGGLQRLLERFGEGAAVHRVTQSIRHRRMRHISPAQCRAIETTLSRRRINQPLDHIYRLRESWASRHADRRGVGQNGTDSQADMGNVVDATLQMRILEGLQRSGTTAHICAYIGDAIDTQAKKPPVGIQRQRSVSEMVARLMIADKNFCPAGDPFHRPATAFGSPGNQCLLGVGEVFGSEATTDVRRDEAQPFRRHIQYPRDGVAIAVQALAGDMSDELL